MSTSRTASDSDASVPRPSRFTMDSKNLVQILGETIKNKAEMRTPTQTAKEMATRSSKLDDTMHVYTAEDFKPSTQKPSTQGPVSDTEIMQTYGSPTFSEFDFPKNMRTQYDTQAALVKAAVNALKSLPVDPHTKADDGIRKYEEDMSMHSWSSDAVSQQKKPLVAILNNETKRAIEPYRATLEEDKQETLASARQSMDKIQREIDKQMLDLDDYTRDLLSQAEKKLASLAAKMGDVGDGGSLDELRKGMATSRKAGLEFEGGSKRVEIVMLSNLIRIEMAYIENQRTVLNKEYTNTVLQQVVKELEHAATATVMRNVVEKARDDLFRAFWYSFPDDTTFTLENISRPSVADSGFKVAGLHKKVVKLFKEFNQMIESSPATSSDPHPATADARNVRPFSSLLDDILENPLRSSSPLTNELGAIAEEENRINRIYKSFIPRLHIVLEFHFLLFLILKQQFSVLQERVFTALTLHGNTKLSGLTEDDELYTEITKLEGGQENLELDEKRTEFINRLKGILFVEKGQAYCDELKFTLSDRNIGFPKMALLDYSGPENIPTIAFKKQMEAYEQQLAEREAYERNIERRKHEASQRKEEKRKEGPEISEEMDYGGIDGLLEDQMTSTPTSGPSNLPPSPSPAESSEEGSNSNSRAKGSSDALGVKAEVAGSRTVVPPTSGKPLEDHSQFVRDHVEKVRVTSRATFINLSKPSQGDKAFLKVMDETYVDDLQKRLPVGWNPNGGLAVNSKLFVLLQKAGARVNEHRDRASVLLRAIQLILWDIPAEVVKEVDTLRNLLNQLQHGRKHHFALGTIIALLRASEDSLHHQLNKDQMDRMIALALIEGSGELYGRELEGQADIPKWIREILYDTLEGHYAELMEKPEFGVLGFALDAMSMGDAPQAEGEGRPEQSVETIDIKGKGRLVSSEDSIESTAGQSSVSHRVNLESTSRQSLATYSANSEWMAGQPPTSFSAKSESTAGQLAMGCSTNSESMARYLSMSNSAYFTSLAAQRFPSLAKSVSTAGPSSASTIRPLSSHAQQRASARRSWAIAVGLSDALVATSRSNRTGAYHDDRQLYMHMF